MHKWKQLMKTNKNSFAWREGDRSGGEENQTEMQQRQQ